MHIVGLLMLAIVTIISWDFVLNYGFRAQWRVHPYGKIMFAFKLATTLVLTLTIANAFFPEYPGRDILRLVIFGGFVVTFAILDLFLRCQLSKKEAKENERDAEVDNAVQ